MKYILILLAIIVTGCSPELKVNKNNIHVFDKWSGYSADCCGWNGYVCGDCKE